MGEDMGKINVSKEFFFILNIAKWKDHQHTMWENGWEAQNNICWSKRKDGRHTTSIKIHIIYIYMCVKRAAKKLKLISFFFFSFFLLYHHHEYLYTIAKVIKKNRKREKGENKEEKRKTTTEHHKTFLDFHYCCLWHHKCILLSSSTKTRMATMIAIDLLSTYSTSVYL